MAKVTTIIDDFNGDEGAKTYRAIIDGKVYEIDLTVSNFKKYFRELESAELIEEALKSTPSKIEVGEISDSEEYSNVKTTDSNEECRSTTAGCPMCGGCTCEISSEQSDNETIEEIDSSFKAALNKVLDKFMNPDSSSDCTNSTAAEEEEDEELEDDNSNWHSISNFSELRNLVHGLFENVSVNQNNVTAEAPAADDRKYLDDLQSYFNELGLPVKVVGFLDKANEVKSNGFETAKQAKDTVKNKIKDRLTSHESEISEFLKDFKSNKPKLDVTSEVLSAMRREFAADRAMGYSRHSVWTKLLANYGRYKIDKKIAASIERTNENIEAFILAYSQLRGK